MRTGVIAIAAAIAAALAGAGLRPGALAAQQDPRLVGAVRLAQEGMSDSARKVAGRLLVELQPGDSLYPEVLYTLGLLAATQQDRRLYLRRVVLDHPLSTWADDALLSLAQLEYGARDPDAAARHAERLVTDYPESPLIAVAALWGARAAGDRRDAELACRLADRGLAAVGTDIELRNQLEFQKQRCNSLLSFASEAAREDSVRRADSAAAARRTGTEPGWYVQVSAVRTRAAAEQEIARVARLEYRGVAVAERGLLKVRVGPFKTRDEAAAALARIKARLGGTPFVTRVP